MPSKASNLAGFASSISANNNLNVGIVTASSFVGNVTGNLTGNVTGNATGLSGTPNLNVGVVTASSFSGNLTGNVTGNLTGTASTATAAATAYGLTGSPNVTVGVLTATTISAGSTTGTSGQVLQSTGTGVTWTVASGGFANMQTFTSPGTFTVPPSTTKVKVIATGGGSWIIDGAKGGGAGATGIAIINLSGPTTVPITIGSAGSPPDSPAGRAGGSTSFGSYITANGSPGLTNQAAVDATFPQPAPTYQSTLNVVGGSGLGAPPIGLTIGAASYWGFSGASTQYPGAGPAKAAFGSGGSQGNYGGVAYQIPPGQGVVVVEW